MVELEASFVNLPANTFAMKKNIILSEIFLDWKSPVHLNEGPPATKHPYQTTPTSKWWKLSLHRSKSDSHWSVVKSRHKYKPTRVSCSKDRPLFTVVRSDRLSNMTRPIHSLSYTNNVIHRHVSSSERTFSWTPDRLFFPRNLSTFVPDVGLMLRNTLYKHDKN